MKMIIVKNSRDVLAFFNSVFLPRNYSLEDAIGEVEGVDAEIIKDSSDPRWSDDGFNVIIDGKRYRSEDLDIADYWYAVVKDREDTDLGTGSFYYDEAVEYINTHYPAEEYPDRSIVIVECSISDSGAIDEIKGDEI